jgi:hypothetical protein
MATPPVVSNLPVVNHHVAIFNTNQPSLMQSQQTLPVINIIEIIIISLLLP